MEKENEVIVSHNFDAPIQLVFDAWTKPEHLKNWWAPATYSTTYCTVDLKIGGLFRYCMSNSEGVGIWGRGLYTEINSPFRLAYLDSFTDKDGNQVPPSYYGLQSSKIQDSKVEIDFINVNNKTTVTIKYSNMVELGEEREMARQGWSEMLALLANYLSNPIKTI